MHPAQRRAVLAIIALLEQGLSQLKSVLVVEDEPATPKAPDPVRPEVNALTDDEEMNLERHMEAARQQMIAEDAHAAERLYGVAPEKTFQGRDPLRLFEGGE